MTNKEEAMSESKHEMLPMPDPQASQLLTGQKAIITGGSSGIGRARAIALAEAGADVAVNYVGNKEKADEVVSRIEDTGRQGMAVKADVSQETDVENMFFEVIKAFGTVDILVNNAGIQQDAMIDRMTLDQWQKLIGVNLTGQLLCARSCAYADQQRSLGD
jgi:glucose 1-dehydrogenase